MNATRNPLALIVIAGLLVSIRAIADASACMPRITANGSADGGTPLNPGGQRLRSAMAADGLGYTRTELPVLDQAATPSLVLFGSLPYLYYTADRPDGLADRAALSIGTADGLGWRHCSLSFAGLPPGFHPVDPDVVELAGGGLRMYVTGRSAADLRIAIHYLESDDGLTWTYVGKAFDHTGSIIDSISFELAGSWHQFALEATSTSMVYGIDAGDGSQFTFINASQRQIDTAPQVISQAARIDSDPIGTLRLFSFGPPFVPGIRSFTTSDGTTLASEGSVHLAFDASVAGETSFIKDPAVVQLASGDYLMVYSTAMVRFHSGFER